MTFEGHNGLWKHKRTGRFYKVNSELTAGYRIKNPLSGKWENCVVYDANDAKHYDKGCIRFKADFLVKFEPVNVKNDVISYSVED